MNLYDTLALIQTISTLFLTGLIWTMQLIHYPLFLQVKLNNEYYIKHQYKTSLLVLPLMVCEIICSIALMILETKTLQTIGLVIVIVIWISTFTLQVPVHLKLKKEFNKNEVIFLIHSNWIRTALWSARSYISVKILINSFTSTPYI